VTPPETRAQPVGQVTSARLDTPLGAMEAAACDHGVCLLEFADRPMLPKQLGRVERRWGTPVPGGHPLLERLEVELREYFDGARLEFDVPLALAGTPFQERVWRCLLEIPYGRTITYDELARQVACPGGQRAVGRANGDNRIAVVVPCHRVVRSGGGLGGYGGGLARKRRLLGLEQGAVQGGLF